MEITDLLNLVPIQIIGFVFAGTYGAKKIFVPAGKKAPRLFPLVPFGLGFVFAFLWYFNTTEPAILKELPTYLKIIRPLVQAVLSAVISMLAWEFGYKKFFAKKIGDVEPPTVPPGSPSPLDRQP